MFRLPPLHRQLARLAGACVLLSAACGPSKTTAGDTGSATTADVDAVCESHCDRSDRCADPSVSSSPHAECVERCVAKLGSAGVFRQDVLTALSGCVEALACNVSDDICTDEAVTVVTTTPTEDPHFLSCRSRHDACSGGAGFSDDECVLRFFLVPSAQTEFDACLQQDCAKISGCLDALRGL